MGRGRESLRRRDGVWHLIPRGDTVAAVPGYRGHKAKKALQDEVRKEEPGSSPRKKRLGGARACRPGVQAGLRLLHREVNRCGAVRQQFWGRPAPHTVRGSCSSVLSQAPVSAPRDPLWGSGIAPDQSMAIALENHCWQLGLDRGKTADGEEHGAIGRGSAVVPLPPPGQDRRACFWAQNVRRLVEVNVVI